MIKSNLATQTAGPMPKTVASVPPSAQMKAALGYLAAALVALAILAVM